MDDRTVPRLLIAPALHWIDGAVPLLGPLIVLHSATDDGLPLDSVQAHLQRIGLSPSAIRIVGEDHTTIDRPALLANQAALSELASRRSAN